MRETGKCISNCGKEVGSEPHENGRMPCTRQNHFEEEVLDLARTILHFLWPTPTDILLSSAEDITLPPSSTEDVTLPCCSAEDITLGP